MFNASAILRLFKDLDAELARQGVFGEVGLCGGAVMCLVFNARAATKDVDGIFEPTAAIRKAAAKVARKNGVAEDWLNDAAKGYFLADPPKVDVLSLPNLRVWAPSAEYMLAMKCVSARFDSSDKLDVQFLLKHLGITEPDQAFEIVTAYYPRKAIPAKTSFLIEELLDSAN